MSEDSGGRARKKGRGVDAAGRRGEFLAAVLGGLVVAGAIGVAIFVRVTEGKEVDVAEVSVVEVDDSPKAKIVEDASAAFTRRDEGELAALADKLFTVESIPKVYVTVDKVVMDRVYYPVEGIDIVDAVKAENNYLGLAGEIKARGNTSYDAGKAYGPMPYKIKLAEKLDLFGMGKSKKWVLLSTFLDRSYLRQMMGFGVGRMIMGEQYFSPEAKYVEFYYNGEYKGLYLLAESIEEDDARLEIERVVTEEDVEVPYLLELDMALPGNDVEFCHVGIAVDRYLVLEEPMVVKPGRCGRLQFTLQYPQSFNEMTESQEQYIYDSVDGLMRELSAGVAVGDLGLDVQAMVEYFLFQEIFDNNGFAHSSTFLYKPVGGEITMGPVWDFDMFMTNVDSVGFNVPETYDNPLYRKLLKDGTYATAIRKRFLQVEQEVMPLVREKLVGLRGNAVLKAAVLRDQALHGTWGVKLEGLRAYQNDNIVALRSFEEHVDYILGWMWDGLTVKQWWYDGSEISYPGRLDWLEEHLDEWGDA